MNLDLIVFSQGMIHRKIQNLAYVINLKDYDDIYTHWVAFHIKDDNTSYFDSFGSENVSNGIKKLLGNKKGIRFNNLWVL